MGETTEIAWCHSTFNPWWGCQRVSPGCEHCYAEAFAKRTGHQVWGPKSEHRFFKDKHWNEPLKWNREAVEARTRRRVFCASMADVFEDRRDLDPWRRRLWSLIEETTHLDWLLLTKRPENMVRMLPMGWLDRPRPNVWLGTTAEDQTWADKRIPDLLRIPAVVHFLSCEPLLGLLQIASWLNPYRDHSCQRGGVPLSDSDQCAGCHSGDKKPVVDWVIAGGESGGKARKFYLNWAADLQEQCAKAGTPYFFKQAGANVWAEGAGLLDDDDPDAVDVVHLRLKNPKGGDLTEIPPEMRVRQFPKPRKEAA